MYKAWRNENLKEDLRSSGIKRILSWIWKDEQEFACQVDKSAKAYWENSTA
jgi:hypothetical protein